MFGRTFRTVLAEVLQGQSCLLARNTAVFDLAAQLPGAHCPAESVRTAANLGKTTHRNLSHFVISQEQTAIRTAGFSASPLRQVRQLASEFSDTLVPSRADPGLKACSSGSDRVCVPQSQTSQGQRLTRQTEACLRQQRLASASPRWSQQFEDLTRSSRRLLSAPQRNLRIAQNQLTRTGGKIYDLLPYQVLICTQSLQSQNPHHNADSSFVHPGQAAHRLICKARQRSEGAQAPF